MARWIEWVTCSENLSPLSSTTPRVFTVSHTYMHSPPSMTSLRVCTIFYEDKWRTEGTWLNSFEPIPGWPRLYAVLVWMDERNSLVRYCWAIWEVQLVIFCVLMNSVVLHATREIRHLQCRCWRALVQISYLVAHLGLGWKEQMFRFPP